MSNTPKEHKRETIAYIRVSLFDALSALERIEGAGGSLHSASGEVGDDSPTGELTRNIFLTLAEWSGSRPASASLRPVEASLLLSEGLPVVTQ